jgi:hypothetical protein
VTKLAGKLVSWSLGALGLTMMATPLALWIAWSETVFFIVLIVGGVAAALYCFLVDYEPPPGPQRAGPPYHRLEAWMDQMVARVQRLYPFVHRNHLPGTARFYMAMHRLRRRLFSERDWF